MRIDALQADAMSPEQRRVHDLIASGPRGVVRGPLAIWLHRPALAEHAQALGRYCRFDSSLEPRLSELGILVMAGIWRSAFEWWAHEPLALAAGVAPSVVEALRRGTTPIFIEEDEAAVYDFLTVLNRERRIPDALFSRALAVLGQDRVVDLVGLAGYYTLISMTLNVFDVLPPAANPFERS